MKTAKTRAQRFSWPAAASLLALAFMSGSLAQPAGPPDSGGPPPGDFGGPPPGDFGGPPPFFMGPGGRGPGGPMIQQKLSLVEKFDKDGDHRLNAAERKAARAYLAEQNQGGFRRRFGFGRGGEQEAPQPGAKLTPADVKAYPGAPLYDPQTIRTLFLEFEDADWEKELAEFKHTDIDVPAKLTVDGKVYPEVGVHFRGMSSFMMVSDGHKRSLNLRMDFAHKGQELGGYRTLNLLNSHEDPTFLRSILSYQIAREYLAAPKANFMRVVINGESWGIYVNVEQFNKDFVKEWYGTTKGARWKVPGSPGGQGSLAYLGDDASAYKQIYQIKSKDDAQSWADLIKLCKVLNETPAEQLEAALSPLLDIEGALRFLALQNALINNDGYWIRTSDYVIYQEPKGRFHILPQDSNENFLRPEGPMGGPPGRGGRFGRGGFGFGGGRGKGPGSAIQGVQLDPLINADDPSKPLISKLLAVPDLRVRYLGYVREIAAKWLDWEKLGPIAQRYHDLIIADVQADTRKLDSTEDFLKNLTEDIQGNGFGPGGGGTISLKNFADQRRKYLLEYPAIKNLSTNASAAPHHGT